MDLVYGSKDNRSNSDIQIFKLGSKKFIFEENLHIITQTQQDLKILLSSTTGTTDSIFSPHMQWQINQS